MALFPTRLTINSDTPPAPTFLRMSAGYIYFHFGFLKFFPDLSPGELLATQTMMKVSLHWLDASTALWWLAVLECAIGLSFLFNVCLHWTFFVFLLHQASTFLPLFLLPELTFKIAPLAPTLEGQYILKNIVSVAAGWTVMLPAVQQAWSVRLRVQPLSPSADPALPRQRRLSYTRQIVVALVVVAVSLGVRAHTKARTYTQHTGITIPQFNER